ncbi:MAG: OsmC family protein [Armatimonadota bacterium]|nr:OsmC family protein [Armatimonadota bacterium]MDR7519962.1 OsmC family protein [Armatimonadota bacterium]MDR7548589.1 OsmC family protein [Armatimonadota bacterium]
MKTQVTWTPPMRFDGAASSGGTLVMDARPEHGGTGAGPSPLETVLMAMAGCTGMDVVSILQKMRAPLKHLTITVDGERAAEHPRVFTSIRIRYEASGAGLTREQVERAVILSLEKYCSVTAMLRQTAEITHEIVLSGDVPAR